MKLYHKAHARNRCGVRLRFKAGVQDCETALSVRLEGRRQRLITGILGIFFTVATSARGEYELLHLGGALWMILTLLTGQSGEKAEDAG